MKRKDPDCNRVDLDEDGEPEELDFENDATPIWPEEDEDE